MSVQDDQVRILLADEQSLFREAVRVVLESEPDLRVVAEARDGAQALAEAERLEPDVALVDAGLPNTDGLQATSEIRARVPGCRVLVLGTQEDDLLTLVGALESGATGYLTKDNSPSVLLEAIRKVDKPALVYKVLAAGRKCQSEEQKHKAIEWAYQNIKPIDATIIGLYPRYSDQVTETTKMVRSVLS